jgi:ABC-2 type transport system permease protein
MADNGSRALHAAAVYRRSIGAYLRSIAEYPADFWVMALAGTTWQACSPT